MDNKKKLRILALLLVFGIIAITMGITYAFFTYSKTGTTENTISSGSISFHYKEVTGMGRGIAITDALPVASNNDAKSSNKTFDFRITSSTTSGINIPYTVTARMDKNSDAILGEIVNIYLTEVNDGTETATDLFSSTLKKYNELEQYDKVAGYTEKVIYTDTVDSANYEKNFKLRMWMDQGANLAARVCSVEPETNDTEEKCTTAHGTWDYKYNNKQFSITVNVYAKGDSGPQVYTAADVSYSNANSTLCTGAANQTVECALNELNTLLN